MSTNVENRKILEYSKVINPIKPKYSGKTNIYFLSKKIVREEKRQKKIKLGFLMSFLTLIIVGTAFITG